MCAIECNGVYYGGRHNEFRKAQEQMLEVLKPLQTPSLDHWSLPDCFMQIYTSAFIFAGKIFKV